MSHTTGREEISEVALIYPYPDDGPLVVVNPPGNLASLIAEWRRLDDGDADGFPLPGWDGVVEWLEARGVTFVNPRVYQLGRDG